MNFSEALQILKDGGAVARTGWNGYGMWLKLQRPDEHSKMTEPYIYLNIPKDLPPLGSSDKKCVPWLASQTDLLGEDWEEFGKNPSV